MHAVRVCTNNSVFATTLFARHNLADLSRHPLYSGAAIYYCRAAREQFLKSLFLYNLVRYYSQLKRSLVCVTGVIAMHYPWKSNNDGSALHWKSDTTETSKLL